MTYGTREPTERMRSMWDSIYAHPEPIDATARRVLAMEPRWVSAPTRAVPACVSEVVDVLRPPPGNQKDWRGFRTKHHLVIGFESQGLRTRVGRRGRPRGCFENYSRWYVLDADGGIVVISNNKSALRRKMERADERHESSNIQ